MTKDAETFLDTWGICQGWATWMLSYSWDGYGAAWRCNRWTWKSCQWDNWQFTWCRCCSHGRGQQWHQWKSFGRAASISISFYRTAIVSLQQQMSLVSQVKSLFLKLRAIYVRFMRDGLELSEGLADSFRMLTIQALKRRFGKWKAQQDWWRASYDSWCKKLSTTIFSGAWWVNFILQWWMFPFTAGYNLLTLQLHLITYSVFANMVWADAVKAKHRTVPSLLAYLQYLCEWWRWRWKVSPSVTNFNHGMDHRIW